ncbi:ABC transporter permease [Ekhidna sp.]
MNLPFFISKRIAKESTGSFSSIINRVAVVSIGLGLAVLIIAFMVLFGFKKVIRDKVYSFSGHLIVNKYTLSTSFEEGSIVLDEDLIDALNNYPRITSYQPYAMKAALLKTKEEVHGVIVKGVDNSFDTVGFNKHIVEGRLPNFNADKYSTEVALSKRVSNYLELEVDDEVLIYFVQNPPRFRRLQISGIYETGLEEFDEKIIIGDLDLVRRINSWPDSLAGGVEIFCDLTPSLDDYLGLLRHNLSSIVNLRFDEYTNDIQKYILTKAESELFNILDIDLYVDKVYDRYAQIFEWLNLLNRNVVILLGIILFVSGTSIISILLILIMERTKMIGMMKSLGATDKMIRSIFVYNGLRLVMRGLLWGNVIGVSIGLIQDHFKIIPLDAANYYMSHVPIVIDISTILFLNILILFLIGLTLLIPVAFISKVQPVKAIRFD